MPAEPFEPAPGPTVGRSDARRNRSRILEAARTALAASSDAPLSSIARLAGVGQGTLYRHFPDREALLVAVYHQDIREVLAAAPGLLHEHPPLDALRRWLDRLASYGRVKKGAAAALQAAAQVDLSNQYRQPVLDTVDLMLEAGKAEGAIRTDVDAADVLLLVGFLWRIEDADWEPRTRHLLDVVMRGLRS